MASNWRFPQFFDWGFQIHNPPPVTWVLIGLHSLAGPDMFPIMALRIAILFAIYSLSLRIGKHLFDDERLATLSPGR